MTENSKKYDGVRLRVLSFEGHSFEPALRRFAAEFGEQTGAMVEIVSLPGPYGWWHLAAIAQDDSTSERPTYDMFCDDREYQFHLLPHLLPLNPFIRKYGYEMGDFLAPVYRYDEGIAGQEGTRYGLPIRVRTTYIFYRTDLLGDFPTTWEEYERALAGQTGDGRYGLAVEGSAYTHHPFGPVHDLTKLFLARYWSFGEPLLTPEWEPLINGPGGVEALEMLGRHIREYSPPDVLTWDHHRAAEAFLSGEVAAIETVGATLLPGLLDGEGSRVGDRWSVAAYPGGSPAPYTLHNLLLFRHCAHPDAAFEFMAYCTNPDAARRLQLEYGEHSVRKSALLSPESIARDPTVTIRAAALERAIPTIAGAPQNYDMLYALWEAVQLYLHGYTTAQKALDRAARNWRRLLSYEPPTWEYYEYH